MGNTNSQVVHIWAQNRNVTAKSSNGNISCDNGALYSYRTPVAKWYGSTAVYTKRKYSITTNGKHLNHVPRALQGQESYRTSLEIDNLPDNWEQVGLLILKDILKELGESVSALKRKRTDLERSLDRIKESSKQARKLAETVHIELSTLSTEEKKVLNLLAYFLPCNNNSQAELSNNNMLHILKDEFGVDIQAKIARQEELGRIAHVKEQKAQEARLQIAKEKLGDWLSGTIAAARDFYELPVYLRLTRDKESIETSHGANIPTDHAIKLWEKINANNDVSNMRLGHFTVISWENNILTVGCHKIPGKQLNKIATLLGL